MGRGAGRALVLTMNRSSLHVVVCFVAPARRLPAGPTSLPRTLHSAAPDPRTRDMVRCEWTDENGGRGEVGQVAGQGGRGSGGTGRWAGGRAGRWAGGRAGKEHDYAPHYPALPKPSPPCPCPARPRPCLAPPRPCPAPALPRPGPAPAPPLPRPCPAPAPPLPCSTAALLRLTHAPPLGLLRRNVLLRCLFDVADQVLNQPRKYAFIQDRLSANAMATYLLQVAPTPPCAHTALAAGTHPRVHSTRHAPLDGVHSAPEVADPGAVLLDPRTADPAPGDALGADSRAVAGACIGAQRAGPGSST